MPPRGSSRRGNWRDRGNGGGGMNRGGGGNGRGDTRGGGRGRGERRERPDETPEQQEAKASYNIWKRLLKRAPTPNDINTIRNLWKGALDILNDDDRDWKQQLPRDLDDDELFGRQHISTIMEMKIHLGGSETFVELTFPFLKAIAHEALLDCLAVDTAVGGLYNYISGSNGTRAIPFFLNICTSLVDTHLDGDPTTSVDQTLLALSRILRELLRREQRVQFNDELPQLFNAMENIMEVANIDKQSVTFQLVSTRLVELRGIVARANGLLQKEIEEPNIQGVSTTVVSTYPRPIGMDRPQNRHDNDKVNIADVKLLPTVDEIRSNHRDFLPTTNRDMPHFLQDQAQRHIDTHFRLLRHDIFGELKEALGGLVLGAQNDPAILENPRLNLGDKTRAYAYPNAEIRYISFEQKRGLEVQISFPQPPQLRRKSSAERSRWWQESKRLDDGVLLCYLSLHNGVSLLFFTVTNKQTGMDGNEHTLASHDKFATITTSLATKNQVDLERMMRLHGSGTHGVLIELPGVIMATFVPVLESLQNMSKLNRFPFRQWILPDRLGAQIVDQPCLDVPPPMYARDANFVFSLKSILKGENEELNVDPRGPSDDLELLQRIEEQTTLDRGQCQALLSALTQEFVQIQGPPGTGKSFLGVKLMSVLLDAAPRAKLGPIIVVCYTNHALDQFLEHLIDIGVDKIIRIGGQSKSDRLEGKNLRVVAKTEGKTRSESYFCAMTYRGLEDAETPIKGHLKALHDTRRPSWPTLKNYLNREYPRIHRQFSRVDDEGFEIVGREPFDLWLPPHGSGITNPEHDTQTIDGLLDAANLNVYSIPESNKRRLLEFWLSQIREGIADNLYESVKQTDKLRQELTNVHDEVDRRVLQTADVIGVTTTGLAKRIATLQHVQSKVILVEEAGEIMEPHLLTALLPTVEHLISIGDHQQLRPTLNNWSKLSLESSQGAAYQLDRSQFERLSFGEPGRPKLPVSQLNVQRRMRPEVSALIRETIYPRLADHDSVRNLPNVVGLRDNVFFFHHENLEDGNRGDKTVHQKSHGNIWEVEMTHALVRHLVRQGEYKSTDIAVLTPYTGQLQKLRAKFQSEFEIVLSDRDEDLLVKDGFIGDDVEDRQVINPENSARKPLAKKMMADLLRLATVDNFQGEEAKVVVVSLVRSNKEKKPGFLRTTNRINVLLSRAQHGLYLIGNSDTYQNVPMWNQVLAMLRAQNNVGPAFRLCCPRHTDIVAEVFSPADFERLSPEGGCQLICERRLACGHQCVARCHSESLHAVFSCPKPCERLHSPCQHSCQKYTCGEDCGRCMVKVNNVNLPCGHTGDNIFCYEQQNLESIKCSILVEKQGPRCGHSVKIKCSVNVLSPLYNCPTTCDTILKCGHTCGSNCGRCRQPDGSMMHSQCQRICGRPFATCNHKCGQKCHDGSPCGTCSQPCQVQCGHSKCPLPCKDSCAPCLEPCQWGACEHSQQTCTLPCGAPCNRTPCNNRCQLLLTGCGHQCPSICGETCPQGYCRLCSTKQDCRVDLLEMKTYSEINVDETPIVVLGCGHFFTAETLDGMIGMSDVYEVDGNGDYTSVKESSEMASVPKCPDCNSPIRQYVTRRYNRVVNRGVIDEMSKRYLVEGQTKLRDLEGRLEQLETTLGTGRAAISKAASRTDHTGRLSPAMQLGVQNLLKRQKMEASRMIQAVARLRREVGDKNQPAQKLQDATIKAVRDNQPLDAQLAGISLGETMRHPPRDQRVTLGAQSIEMEINRVIVLDQLLTFEALRKSDVPLETFSVDKPNCPKFLAACEKFIKICKADNLPKLAVKSAIYFGEVARGFHTYCRKIELHNEAFVQGANTAVEEAKELLKGAGELCKQPFQQAAELVKVVESTLKSLQSEWYEAVTPDELTAIKAAMVSGRGGIATHTGHWYNCSNGHPFAIGECGMPMQQARCPECGCPVGGQNHEAVAGVTRATHMER